MITFLKDEDDDFDADAALLARARIRELNDQLRRTGKGGKVLMTSGIAAQSPEQIAAIMQAVAVFDSFDGDNDPWSEHDAALLMVGDEQIFWKIDCYDLTLTCLSPDPADPAVTVRVLTVMLPREY